jgi:putrescine importer
MPTVRLSRLRPPPQDEALMIVTAPRLRRALTLRELILYGVVVICPIGPMGFFGILSRRGGGHAATTILLAMLAMLLTAISYGRMARVYPSAGSAFAYVGREVHPFLGYVTGWGMVMDYLLGPLVCTIWCSQQLHVFIPEVPYWAWAVLYSMTLTGLNIQGVKVSARVNAALFSAMGLLIFAFLFAATVYVFHHPHTDSSFFTRPFYDPQTWRFSAILGGTSLAVLTYIGFDGISTLAEEARNPRRDIMTATVLTCLIIGILSALQVYMAQLVWPGSEPFPNVDTAFMFVAKRVWAPLFGVTGLTMIAANVGAALGTQLAAGRLLYCMGRSGALPKSYFGVIDPNRRVPCNSILFVGTLGLLGSLALPLLSKGATAYELGANLVNFGALVAFMGVNAAAFLHYYVREKQKKLTHVVIPVLGFCVCLLLWWGLSAPARVFGVIWISLGIASGACRTGGLAGHTIDFEFAPEPEGDLSGGGEAKLH